MVMVIPKDILKDWDVLVVDDEPDSILIIQTLLKRYGANVITAHNGEEGIQIARQQRPRFIIADLSMPKVSGWEMVNVLKNDRSTLGTPIVALTAHAMPGDRDRALAMGFHNYLTKPLRPETFVNDLLSLLAYDMPELSAALNPSEA